MCSFYESLKRQNAAHGVEQCKGKPLKKLKRVCKIAKIVHFLDSSNVAAAHLKCWFHARK